MMLQAATPRPTAPNSTPSTRRMVPAGLLRGFLCAVLALTGCAPAARPAAPAQTGSGASAAPAGQPAAQSGPQAADVNFRFSWLDIGYNAPFYLAQDRGYYREAGLNVTLAEGRGGDTTLKLIANGSNDLGMSDAGVVLRGISQGMPVRAIAASMRKHPMATIYPKSAPLPRAADLVGKTVAMPTGSAQAFLFPAYLQNNGVDKNSVRVALVDA